MWPQVLRLPQNEQKRGEDCGQWIHSRMAISAPPKLSFPASFPLRVCEREEKEEKGEGDCLFSGLCQARINELLKC